MRGKQGLGFVWNERKVPIYLMNSIIRWLEVVKTWKSFQFRPVIIVSIPDNMLSQLR